MNEKIFWEFVSLIDYHPETFYNIFDYQKYQADLIKQELLELPFHDVLEFDKIYNQKLDALFLSKIIEIHIVGFLPFEKLKEDDIYVSNDIFRDFRGWVIGQGQKTYELIKNFEKEEEILHLNFHIENANLCDIEMIANQLYEESYSKPHDDEVERLYKNHHNENYFLDFSEILNQINWKNLDKKYPKSFAKYHP